jgi:hypothetical protein
VSTHSVWLEEMPRRPTQATPVTYGWITDRTFIGRALAPRTPVRHSGRQSLSLMEPANVPFGQAPARALLFRLSMAGQTKLDGVSVEPETKQTTASPSSDRRVGNTILDLSNSGGSGRRSNISEFIVTIYWPVISRAVEAPSLADRREDRAARAAGGARTRSSPILLSTPVVAPQTGRPWSRRQSRRLLSMPARSPARCVLINDARQISAG